MTYIYINRITFVIFVLRLTIIIHILHNTIKTGYNTLCGPDAQTPIQNIWLLNLNKTAKDY